jgi:hypothetical protein
MNYYRVKFFNPEKQGSGFIDGFRLARHAKETVEKFNTLYDKLGDGLRAEYLGRAYSTKKESAA